MRIADTPALVYVLLAAHAIGAVPIPTYVQLRAEDLVYRLEDSGARFAVTSAEQLDEMEAAVAATPDVTLALADVKADGRFASLPALLPEAEAEVEYYDRPRGGTHPHRLHVGFDRAPEGGLPLPPRPDRFGRFILEALRRPVRA